MGALMENSITCRNAAPLILHLRNLITPVFLSADKSLLSLSQKSNLLKLLRWFLLSSFLFFLHLFRSFLSLFDADGHIAGDNNFSNYYYFADDDNDRREYAGDNLGIFAVGGGGAGGGGGGGSAIARALKQLLGLVNAVPVSSRKYDAVRCLAEKLMEENLKEGSETLRLVNCEALSGAFGRTLRQLEAALLERRRRESGLGLGLGFGPGLEFGLRWFLRVVRGYWYGVGRGGGGGEGGDDGGIAAEKMAAELVWMAEKLEESGGVEVAVGKWASASKLGWLALSAEPRIQASLVKLTAFLIRQAKNMEKGEESEGRETEQQKQIKVKMLLTWLPLLCRATNGTDAPTLTIKERGELEIVIEGMIDTLEEETNQEKILCLWLHHFSQCATSDWPNLYGSYLRWCTASRKLLLT